MRGERSTLKMCFIFLLVCFVITKSQEKCAKQKKIESSDHKLMVAKSFIISRLCHLVCSGNHQNNTRLFLLFISNVFRILLKHQTMAITCDTMYVNVIIIE